MNCKLIVLFIMLAASSSSFTAEQLSGNPGKESEKAVYRRYEPEPERWHDPFGVYWKEARPVDFVYPSRRS